MPHLVLIEELGMTPDQAPQYPIHGSKHYLIIVGTQFQFDQELIRKMGRWHVGFKMFDKYKQTKGVDELRCRIAIQEQFQRGWRPVQSFEDDWIANDEADDRRLQSFLCKSQAEHKRVAKVPRVRRVRDLLIKAKLIKKGLATVKHEVRESGQSTSQLLSPDQDERGEAEEHDGEEKGSLHAPEEPHKKFETALGWIEVCRKFEEELMADFLDLGKTPEHDGLNDPDATKTQPVTDDGDQSPETKVPLPLRSSSTETMVDEGGNPTKTPPTPVFDDAGIFDLRARIFNRGDWKILPPRIRDNEYTVVQSDTKYHVFNGVGAALCNVFRCGCVENARPRVIFHMKVPADVRINSFCVICCSKTRATRQADANERAPRRKVILFHWRHGETVDKNLGDIHCFTAGMYR